MFNHFAHSGWVYTRRGTNSWPAEGASFGQRPAGDNEPDDMFGSSLAVGDFNGDNFDDLAIGAPGEVPRGLWGDPSGSVYLQKGTRNGLISWRALGQIPLGQFLQQRPLSQNEEGDLFGWSLATGDLNGDGFDDLIVGAPGEQLDNPPQEFSSGLVYIFHSVQGLLRAHEQVTQEGLGRDEPDDQFGWSLAVGDFDDDGATDLVVGAPGETMRLNNQSGYAFTYRTVLGRLEGWHGIHQESR